MKTSNKIILITLVLIVVAIIVTGFLFKKIPPTSEVLKYTYTFFQEAEKKPIEGVGELETRHIKNSAFQAVAIKGNFKISLQQGESDTVSLAADKNLWPYLNFYISNHKLNIKEKSGYILNPQKPMQLVIHAKSLKKADISGRIKLDIDKLDSYRFRLNLDGKTNTSLSGGQFKRLHIHATGKTHLSTHQLQANAFTLNTEGDANVMLEGFTNTFILSSDGNSNINTKNLTTKELKISTSGETEAIVYANMLLKITAMGNTHLTYYGDPKKIDKTTYGLATIQKGETVLRISKHNPEY